MNRNFTFYILILVIFGSLIWLILHEGEKQNPLPSSQSKVENSTSNATASKLDYPNIQGENHTVFSHTLDTLKKQISAPMGILLIQIIIIVIFSRILGLSISKLGQPIVIGEIIAGIILGPSLLGSHFPEVYKFIFPANSLNNLQLFSQFGLVLFMFIIGMEIDTKLVRKKINSAIIISFTGIIFPYFLGILLSYFIYSSFSMPGVSFMTFALFIGIAMSITAFPVLARIIHEKGLTKTSLGIMALTCAATDDITAWLIFAVIIALAQAGTAISAVLVIVSAILFLLSMLFIARPILKRIGGIYISSENLSKTIIASIFLILFVSALFTEIIGIHALFGAFIAGVVIPKNQIFKKLMISKIEDVSTVVLLPLFFAFSGLRTQIGSLNTPYLWGICGIVILIAIIGKLGGISIAARVVGNSWRDSLKMGVLMNTRGLMELIVLNIGYDLGILSPEIFSIMVLMALTTTFMAGPILNLLERTKKSNSLSQEKHEQHFLRILISFGNPKMGPSLLKLAYHLAGKDKTYYNIKALHLTPHTEVTHSNALKFEDVSFIPIKDTADALKMDISTIYKTADDVAKAIVSTCRKEDSNLLLIGAAKSVFTQNIIGGKVKTIVDRCNCNVGVLIEKDFHELNNVLIIADRARMDNLLDIAHRFSSNSDAMITFSHSSNKEEMSKNKVTERLRENQKMNFVGNNLLSSTYFESFDLIVISLKYFEKEIKNQHDLTESTASLLLINFTDDTFLIRAEDGN